MGSKEPVELFDSLFISSFANKKLISFNRANKKDLTSSQRIIALYSTDTVTSVPDFVIELIPEIVNNEEEFIMNKVRNGRIILIKAKNQARLIEIIKGLPDNFLDNEY